MRIGSAVRFSKLTPVLSQDPLLKVMADGANVAVVSIGYRLAPEHPFPQGPEVSRTDLSMCRLLLIDLQDCFDVVEWLADNAEKKFGAPLKFMGGEARFSLGRLRGHH